MGMVAPLPQIASAYFVLYGQYGDVSRYAAERGVCRQWVYREAHWLRHSLASSRAQIDALEQRVRELELQQATLQQRLKLSVELDEDKQAQLAAVGQANGVSLPSVWIFLDVLIPGQQLSVASLGRRTQARVQFAAMNREGEAREPGPGPLRRRVLLKLDGEPVNG